MNTLEKFKELLKNDSKRIILQDENRSWTLADINRISNQMAQKIEIAFASKEVVPVQMNSDINLISSIIAIFKTGKIYYPLPAEVPESHINKLMRSVSAETIFSDDSSQDLPMNICSFQFNHEKDVSFETKNQNENAYIISTSGSTGLPKGVLVSHNNLSWFLQVMQDLFPLNANDKFLLSTPYNFDVSIHELLSFIFGDGTLYSISAHSPIRKLQILPQIITENNVTHLALSPSSASFVVDHVIKNNQSVSQLKNCFLAGEVLSGKLVKKLQKQFPEAQCTNLYGPTETTVYATYFNVPKGFDQPTTPIGAPLPGVKIVLAEGAELSEILIGGEGVSKGYYNNYQKTSEKFIYENQNIFYKSGDLGSYLNENELIFNGRSDDQIKINGVRVEPEEIEISIQDHLYSEYSINAQIKIIYLNKKLNCIVATNVKNDIRYKIEKISTTHLPRYYRPQTIIQIDAIPLTPARKADIKQLKCMINKLELTTSEEITKSSQPNGELNDAQVKDKIIEILSQISGRDMKGIEGNKNLLTSAGIDSLDTLRFLIDLENFFSIKLNDDVLIIHNTIEKLVNHISEFLDVTYESHEETINQEIHDNNRFEIIESNYLANSFLLSTSPSKVVPTSYIQKCYYYDNFDNIMNVKIRLGDVADIEKINDTITSIVKSNFVFSSNIDIINSDLVFQNRLLDESYNYKLLILKSLSSEEKDFITNMLSKVWRLKTQKYFFVFDQSSGELNGFFSHYIFDQASLDIFKKQVIDEMLGQYRSTTKDYDFFIDILRTNKSDFNLDNLLEKGFIKIPEDNLAENSHSSKQIQYISISKEKMHRILGVSSEEFSGVQRLNLMVNFIVLKSLISANNWKAIGGTTIENIRNISNVDFSKTLGDLHSTIPILCLSEDSFKDFSSRYFETYSEYKQGNNFYQKIYSTYPNISETDRKFELYLEDNLKLSLNYLGEIRKTDLNKKVDDVLKARSNLTNFSSTKLYATFFTSGDDVYIIPMNPFIKLDKDLINKTGAEIKFKVNI